MTMDRHTRGVQPAVGGAVCAVLFSLPWCCVLPAVFSLLGLAGIGGAVRVSAMQMVPYLLVISVFFLGRAHWLIHVRDQGNRVSRVLVWVSTGIAVSFMAYWGIMLLPLVGSV